ncbi:hypothetical protein MHH52_21070 [Paenibacillus sp. FSL K6-0276]|uniref:hypothetical protein n=1 Tax=Paenibacillus sp. FSL K6-0276 TaxID=2921450 RepID=UPI0030EEA8EA
MFSVWLDVVIVPNKALVRKWVFNNEIVTKLTEKSYANVQGSSVLVGTTGYDVDIYMARLLSGSLPDCVYVIKQSASNPG